MSVYKSILKYSNPFRVLKERTRDHQVLLEASFDNELSDELRRGLEARIGRDVLQAEIEKRLFLRNALRESFRGMETSRNASAEDIRKEAWELLERRIAQDVVRSNKTSAVSRISLSHVFRGMFDHSPQLRGFATLGAMSLVAFFVYTSLGNVSPENDNQVAVNNTMSVVSDLVDSSYQLSVPSVAIQVGGSGSAPSPSADFRIHIANRAQRRPAAGFDSGSALHFTSSGNSQNHLDGRFAPSLESYSFGFGNGRLREIEDDIRDDLLAENMYESYPPYNEILSGK
jgi:hypothetical protein